MTAVTREELWARLDELLAEVRRQGRAAIAAQAAAEQCLEAVAAPDNGAGSRPEAARWLQALLPVADAIDRLEGVAEAVAREPGGVRFWALLRRSEADPRLAEGLRLLREQLRDALESRGVEVLRPRGERFDPSRHRAVETRPGPAERIIDVVRPGYAIDDRVIREAEVVVGQRR